MDCDALMILPIQLVPRYPLLLGRLRKLSDTSNEHHRIIEIAYQFVKHLSVKINEVQRYALVIDIRDEEATLRFWHACTRDILNLPADFLSSNRRFIDSYTASVGVNGSTSKTRRVYLFSDSGVNLIAKN